VESDDVRKRASAILVTTMMGLRVAMGTERPRAGLEGLEQTGELQALEKRPTQVDVVTPQGAVTARETCRRNRYRAYCTGRIVGR
jgi:hypothetical protein